ncbi:MAG: CaiB/BaiF CoA-transferase family protein [Desulfomonilaceae bacterium]
MSRALADFKVLDLSMNLPGPYMTWLLASLGAEVIKVENPAGGDYARALGGGEVSPFFAAVNRNKKSLTLNLKHPEGKRLFLKLVDICDIIVEGFRPGTMERLGLNFDVLSARNSRLIYVSITGYGHNGPFRLRAGHDVNYLSLAGIIGMSGTREGSPAIPGVQIADLAGGSLMALSGLLAAIIQREKTGRGQFVDAAMFDGALSLATMVFGGVQAGLERAEAGQMLLTGRFPCYGLYRTSDGKYMSLGALESKFWENFCAAVNRKDLIEEQFGAKEFVVEVQQIFASRTRDEWVELLKDSDACCEPVLSLDEAVNSPLAEARDMVTKSSDGRRFLTSPIKLSDSPAADDQPAPNLGQHTHEILRGLGLTAEDLASMAQQGVI